MTDPAESQAFELVRYTRETSERFNVLVGDVVVSVQGTAESAGRMVRVLREVVTGAIRKAIEHHRDATDRHIIATRQRVEAQEVELDEQLVEAAQEAGRRVLTALEAYEAERAEAPNGRVFARCCRATLGEAKTRVRKVV